MATVLIVDDEAGMRAVLSNLLEKQGYTILTGEDGKEAIEIIQKSRVEVVLLDIHLPDIDGVEVLRQIKRIDENLPVIMCSGLDDVEFAVGAMKFGAFDYIRKPFKNEEVIEKIERALRTQARIPKKQNEAPVAVESRTEKKSSPLWIFTGILVLTVLIILAALTRFVLTKNREWMIYSTPYANPTSIAWEKTPDKEYLWVSAWVGQNIYKHNFDDSLSICKVYQFPKNYPVGLAIVRNNILFSDASTGKIYMFVCDENMTLAATYKSPGPNPTGLCWDGTYLWSCDADTHKIYKHRMDKSLSVIDSYDSPGPYPVGIFWDGKSLWSADGQKNKIYKHDMKLPLLVEAEYQPKPLASRENKISGLTWDGKHIWLVFEETRKICKYNMSLLK